MNMEEFKAYCQSNRGVIESFPSDQSILVFKVMDKKLLKELIDHSYNLVVANLPKKRKKT
tara:strand:- start:2142 stop:2321 length:180 start_codon:yes stop_codon:yes gene_type:complete